MKFFISSGPDFLGINYVTLWARFHDLMSLCLAYIPNLFLWKMDII